PSQVAGDRFERGFAYAHPVVEGPGLRRVVEVERDDAAAALNHERTEPLGHGLERIGARLERCLHTLPGCSHEVAAERIARCERDRMDESVEPAPALLERPG